MSAWLQDGIRISTHIATCEINTWHHLTDLATNSRNNRVVVEMWWSAFSFNLHVAGLWGIYKQNIMQRGNANNPKKDSWRRKNPKNLIALLMHRRALNDDWWFIVLNFTCPRPLSLQVSVLPKITINLALHSAIETKPSKVFLL